MKVTVISLFTALGITTWFYSGSEYAIQGGGFISATEEVTSWKTDIDLGSGFVLTTFLTLEKEDNRITMTSPRNADMRIVGRAKSYLGRWTGRLPEGGILLRIQGELNGDSITGNAAVAVLGEMQFVGSIDRDSISGTLFKNDTVRVGTVQGGLSHKSSLDYHQLYDRISEISKENIYNKGILESDEWESFESDLESLCSKAKDDIEMFIGFSMYSSELPFSHFRFFINDSERSDTASKSQSVHFEEQNSSIAYLRIDNFSSSRQELEYHMPLILEKGYEHLIVDLRDNPGGGIESAFAFAKYILNSKTEIGYFTTNRFNYDEFDSSTFGQLPELEPETTEGFIDYLMNGPGSKMILNEHSNEVFTGHIYLLTNSNTASTCEPIVNVLKGRQNITVIGETTAGAMLSATYFDLYDKYKLVLPIADFYTMDGSRLDGVGVAPDISVNSDSALDKTLQLIRQDL